MNTIVTPTKPRLLDRFHAVWEAPKVMEFWLAHLNSLWSWNQSRARVVERIAEAKGSTTLVLKPNGHFKGFRAGQHVNIGVEIDGVRHIRSYSASDAPRADGKIRLTIKAAQAGKVSNHLQALPVGSIVSLSPAFGELTLPDATDEPVLLLAAGSGITPMLSHIQALADQDMPRSVHLMYWTRTRDEQIQGPVLRWLAKQYANLQVTFAVTGETNLLDGELSGRIHAEQLQAGLASNPHVLACGPHGFVETARELAAGAVRSFTAEAFTPAPRVHVEDESGNVSVKLLRSGRTLTIPRNESLLEALEAQGLQPRHGCRMGICNTCVCRKPQGATRSLKDGHVDHEPVESVRLCTSAAHSDLTLDL